MDQSGEKLVNEETRHIIERLLQQMAIKDYAMDISGGALPGENYIGVIAKVIVTGEDINGKNTTLNLIVKSAPTNEGFRAFNPVRKEFEQEVYIYSKVFPAFIKFQEEKGKSKPFNPFAKYYASTLKECNEAIIMENMKALGFSLCDRREPLDYNHVMLVMREYGKLHALSYALRDQQPELFKELSDNTKDIYFEYSYASEDGRKLLKQYSERALKTLDPLHEETIYNKFKNFRENMCELILDMVKSESTGKYSVINHGDCWINNILYKYEDPVNPKAPSELCFLDWQLSRTGSPAFDLSHFIFTCTDKELRDEHYDDMIQEYYNSLTSFLIQLGSDPKKMIPFEVFQQHLKKFALFGLFMAILTLPIMTSESDEIPDFQNLENMDELAESLNYCAKNDESYRKRIRGVILDFVKFDYDF